MRTSPGPLALLAAALLLLGGAAAPLHAQPRPAAADTLPPAGVTERFVTVGGGEWALEGILSLPAGAGPFPVAILMHGSGPGSRDGHVGPNRISREKAWGLAARGVAVLRYPKRTTAHARRLQALGRHATLDEEFTDDAVAAVRLLQADPAIDPRRVFVVGQSQSTNVAPLVAERAPTVAGVILLSVASRGAADLIAEQVAYARTTLAADDTAATARAAFMMAGVARMRDPATPDSAIVLGHPMSYWRAAQQLRPTERAAALLERGGRLLVVHGGRDYLVTDADYDAWRRALEGRPGATFRRYADLNHMMQHGVGRMTPAEYTRRGEIPGYFLDDLASWMRGGPPSR